MVSFHSGKKSVPLLTPHRGGFKDPSTFSCQQWILQFTDPTSRHKDTLWGMGMRGVQTDTDPTKFVAPSVVQGQGNKGEECLGQPQCHTLGHNL